MNGNSGGEWGVGIGEVIMGTLMGIILMISTSVVSVLLSLSKYNLFYEQH